MRDIKARAWDGERMIFFDTLTIGIGKNIIEDSDGHRDKEPYVFFKNDTFNGEVRLGVHTVTLSTTLKDQGGNGDEVYEGDFFESEKGRGVVTMVNGCCMVIFPTYDFSLHEFLKNDTTRKVAGNIHQNPE